MNRTAKFLRFLAALALMPACVAAARTTWLLIRTAYPSGLAGLPASAWSLLAGLAVWLIVYVLLPRPFRTYVLGHELTHAIWGYLMGAHIGRVRVSKGGGSVSLSHTNFLVALAPYFFPFYTMCLIGTYFLLGAFLDLSRYGLLWFWLVGFTWGFHFTFSLGSLLTHQTDIRDQGRLFAYAVIFLFNVVGIGLWTVAVASPTFRDLTDLLGAECAHAYSAVWQFAADACAKIKVVTSCR